MSQKYVAKRSRKRKQTNRWVPALFGLGSLVLLALALLLVRNNGGSKAELKVSGAPGLKVDKELVDLGDVKLGQTVEASFRVTNVGDESLRFDQQPYIEVIEGC